MLASPRRSLAGPWYGNRYGNRQGHDYLDDLLLAASGTTDIVDAHVVICARRTGGVIVGLLLAAGTLIGCGRADSEIASAESEPPAHVAADRFLDAIAGHCGRAYAGRVIVNRPPMADDPFAGRELVMHVRECRAGAISIPFHVGEDRSRTWVLTRTDAGVRLKHDHRHVDGSEDAVTMYGGETVERGSDRRQEFPVDAESIALFEREGLAVSVTNVWAIEVEPGHTFLYELSRPDGRLLQVEFDLTMPVTTPPAPWGHP